LLWIWIDWDFKLELSNPISLRRNNFDWEIGFAYI